MKIENDGGPVKASKATVIAADHQETHSLQTGVGTEHGIGIDVNGGEHGSPLSNLPRLGSANWTFSDGPFRFERVPDSFFVKWHPINLRSLDEGWP